MICGWPPRFRLGRGDLDPAENRLEIGGVHVVGDAQIAVALHLGPAPELRGEEHAVCVQGVGVQVDHRGSQS